VLHDIIELDEYRRTIYPRNVTLVNFIEFSCLPVLVYEPKYPRTGRIDYGVVMEKVVIIAGIFLVEWFLLEHFIVPSVVRLVHEQDPNYSVPEAMLDLAVPLQLFVVLLFYLVFECILGANAELMRLADRMTYADWWNATTFEEFSRKWNKPVHEFLLRHVHIESQKWLGLDRKVATIVTFLYSIVAHEIILLSMFGMFRPYLGFFSLFQIPLWFVMRSPLFQSRVLGNIVFWSCLTIAWPLMCVLYCREYCLEASGNCRLF
jgi:sterol O-acyltransferase